MRCDIVEHGAGGLQLRRVPKCVVFASQPPASQCLCLCLCSGAVCIGPWGQSSSHLGTPFPLSLLLSLSHGISRKRKACEGIRSQVGHCLSSCLVTARNLEHSTVALLFSLPPIPVCKVPQCWDPT